jgi:hypothetical protein
VYFSFLGDFLSGHLAIHDKRRWSSRATHFVARIEDFVEKQSFCLGELLSK